MAKNKATATAPATEEPKKDTRKRSGITIKDRVVNTFKELVAKMLEATPAEVLALIDAEQWDTVQEVYGKALTGSNRGEKPEDTLTRVKARINEIYALGATDITALETHGAELETLFVAQNKAKAKIAKAKEDKKAAASASGK